MNANDIIIDDDVWKRYSELTARIEDNILDNHEYYILSLQRAYDLHGVLRANKELYLLLMKEPIIEKNILFKGRGLLEKMRKKQKPKKRIITEKYPKKIVTYYYFSSCN